MDHIRDVIDVSGGPDVAQHLAALLLMFNGQHDKQVAFVLKKLNNLEIIKSQEGENLAVLLPAMSSMKALLDGCASAGVKKDLALFQKFLESYKSQSIVSVVNASQSALNKFKPKSKTTKRKKTVDQKVIDRIIEMLRNTIGDPDQFGETYKNLHLEELSVDDVVAIAKNIDPSVPNKSSKKNAISKIQKRHDELVKYNKTSKSMAGRSAA